MFWISKVFTIVYTYLHMELIRAMYEAYPLYMKDDSVFVFLNWGHFCLEKQGKLNMNLENSALYEDCTFEGYPDTATA